MVDTKEQRDALVKKVYADNFTHADDCQDIWRLCEMVDELQARAESVEQERHALAERVKALETTMRAVIAGVNDNIQADMQTDSDVIYCPVCLTNILSGKKITNSHHYGNCAYIAARKLLENDHA